MANLLTEQAIAALELGAAAPAPTAAEAAAFAAARAEAEALEVERAAAAATAAAEAAEATAAAAAAEAAASAAAAKPDSGVVAFLKGQVAEKDAALMAATIELRDTKAKLDGIETTHNALTDLVRASVGKMQVALGGTATDLKGLTDVQVLAEHARVAADFTAKFKVGGVAITALATKPEGKVVAADPLQPARLAAVKRATK